MQAQSQNVSKDRILESSQARTKKQQPDLLTEEI